MTVFLGSCNGWSFDGWWFTFFSRKSMEKPIGKGLPQTQWCPFDEGFSRVVQTCTITLACNRCNSTSNVRLTSRFVFGGAANGLSPTLLLELPASSASWSSKSNKWSPGTSPTLPLHGGSSCRKESAEGFGLALIFVRRHYSSCSSWSV